MDNEWKGCDKHGIEGVTDLGAHGIGCGICADEEMAQEGYCEICDADGARHCGRCSSWFCEACGHSEEHAGLHPSATLLYHPGLGELSWRILVRYSAEDEGWFEADAEGGRGTFWQLDNASGAWFRDSERLPGSVSFRVEW